MIAALIDNRLVENEGEILREEVCSHTDEDSAVESCGGGLNVRWFEGKKSDKKGRDVRPYR